MKVQLSSVLAVVLLAGCPESKPAAPVHKVELKKLSGTTVELVPTDVRLPYCLVFTISEKGVVRQLTMNRQNRSVKCEAGQSIGGVSYRIPLEEGPVRFHVFLSSTQLNAGSVAQQIYELSAKNPRFSALDLRLPGDVKVETLDFTPATEAPVATGAVIGSGGQPTEPGAGAVAGAGESSTDGGTAKP